MRAIAQRRLLQRFEAEHVRTQTGQLRGDGRSATAAAEQARDLGLDHRAFALHTHQLLVHPAKLGLGFQHLGLEGLANGIAALGDT